MAIMVVSQSDRMHVSTTGRGGERREIGKIDGLLVALM